MTSVNHYPTFEYSQPLEYRFSHDSVFMARKVFDLIRNDVNQKAKGLDLCSGCGIIGLDLLFHLYTNESSLQFSEFDFIDYQLEYQLHFFENSKMLRSLTHFQNPLNFISKTYEFLVTSQEYFQKYDFVVCNPPYFKPHQGPASPNEFKNKCRFFLEGSIPSLLKTIELVLKPTGKAFLIYSDLKSHKMDLSKEILANLENLKLIELEKIRNSNFIQLNF